MKNIGVLFLILLSFGCSDTKDKALLELIVQNNKYYTIELEEYNLDLYQKGQDMPARFDKEYYQNINNIFIGIKQLKSKAEYNKLFEKVKGLGHKYKIGKSIKSNQSDENEVLKNNLYVNLLNVIHAKKVSSALMQSTHCGGGDFFKIVKKIEKDSVSLDFYTYNNFIVVVDAVSDDNDHLKFDSNKQFKIWNVKYKPKSKNTHCTGKIFLNDDGKVLMVQQYDDKNALSENPFNSKE